MTAVALGSPVSTAGVDDDETFTLHHLAALTIVGLWFLFKFGVVEQVYLPPGAFMTAGMPLLAVLVLLISPRGSVARIPVSIPLLAVLCWTAMSVAWSRDPEFSQFQIRNEIPALLMLLVVAGTLPMHVLRRGLCWLVYAVMALALFTSLTRIDSRVWPASLEPGSEMLTGWRGLFGHKNGLGIFMVLGLAAILAFERRRALRTLGAVLAIVLVIGSRSATAASGLLVALMTWAWLGALGRSRNTRDRALFTLMSVAAIVLAVFIALGLMPAFLDLYGKDLTFSGRTIIWAESMEVVAEHPIIGLGYGGVWYDLQSPITAGLHRQIGFQAAHAHNGVIEVMMEMGLVGLVLFVVFFASILRKAFGLLDTPSTMTARWAITCCSAIAFMAISEVLFQGSMLGFMALVWLVLARTEQEMRADPTVPIETRLGAGRR